MKIKNMEKPKLSLIKIINMSIGFLGIQMAFGLQNSNASRILANFGADVHELSWFWLVAPITGLIVQPIIGHFGDKTWGILGRRKPYFLVGSILAGLGLIFLPNSSLIAGESLTSTEFLGINAILWISILFLALMDASINVSMEPFRALVGDLLPKSQGTLGFSVQTIIIGIGAVLGSSLPWILTKLGVSNNASEGYIADNVVWSFYIGAGILILSIIYTIITTKEYSPEEFNLYNDSSKEEIKQENFWNIIDDFKNMPSLMLKLGAIQFFSWFALFTMWVYTTSAVATHHFGLLPTNTHSQEFNNASDSVSLLFSLYNFFAIPFAFLLIPIAKKTNRKFTHFIALFSGGIGLISMYFIKDISYLWISMLGIGFAWASILAMPYAMLIDTIPLKKMGIYMGIFNFFIVIPQIINGIIGGLIVNKIFHNYAIYYISFGGICMIIAAFITLKIKVNN